MALVEYLLESINMRAQLLTGYSREYFKKVITAKEMERLHERVELLALAANWKEKKHLYGYAFMYEDLKRMINTSSEPIIVIHSLGDFFELHDGNEVEAFIDTLIRLCKSAQKKLLFTIDIEQNFSKSILKAFHHHIDLDLHVRTSNSGVSTLDILFSIQPLGFKSLSFALLPQGIYRCEPLDEASQEAQKPKFWHVVLAGDDTENLDRIAYLFDSALFKVERVEANLSLILSRLISNPDLLVFATKESALDAGRFELCRSVQEQKFKTQIIYVTGKSFIRHSDRRLANASRCHDLFERDFNFEALITSVERFLRDPFYSRRLDAIVPNVTVMDQERFAQYKQACLEARVFFVCINYQAAAIDADRMASVLKRPGDVYCFVAHEERLTLMLLNMTVAHSNVIVEHMRQIDSSLSLLGMEEAVAPDA
ncbi:MAG: hypothetical protein JXK05_11010 [Campylobacterales bacterium]|nr:hypothetical protein [Campylobacterales bacterium]